MSDTDRIQQLTSITETQRSFLIQFIVDSGWLAKNRKLSQAESFNRRKKKVLDALALVPSFDLGRGLILKSLSEVDRLAEGGEFKSAYDRLDAIKKEAKEYKKGYDPSAQIKTISMRTKVLEDLASKMPSERKGAEIWLGKYGKLDKELDKKEALNELALFDKEYDEQFESWRRFASSKEEIDELSVMAEEMLRCVNESENEVIVSDGLESDCQKLKEWQRSVVSDSQAFEDFNNRVQEARLLIWTACGNQDSPMPQPTRKSKRSPELKNAIRFCMMTSEEFASVGVDVIPLNKKPGERGSVDDPEYRKVKGISNIFDKLQKFDEIWSLPGSEVSGLDPRKIEVTIQQSYNKTIEEIDKSIVKLSKTKGQAEDRYNKYNIELNKKYKQGNKNGDPVDYFYLHNLDEKERVEAERRYDDHKYIAAKLKSIKKLKVEFEKIPQVHKGWFENSFELILKDPGFKLVSKYMSLGELVHAKSCGVNFSDIEVDKFNDNLLDLSSSNEFFAQGAINSVAKLTYQDGVTKVFKPESEVGNNSAYLLTTGISEEAPRFGERNIASRSIGELLGSKVIPNATFAIHKGKVGILMDLASGNKALGLKAPEGKKLFESITSEQLSSLNEQLNQLEWCDLISGQGDRHAGNYLFDLTSPTPKITGIDNDLAFGGKFTKINPGKHEMGYTGPGLPQLIDKKTYKALKSVDFDRDLLPNLVGRFTEEEIKATRIRFELTVKHADTLNENKRVVENWSAPSIDVDGTLVSPIKFLTLQEKGSLFQRDLAMFVPQELMEK